MFILCDNKAVSDMFQDILNGEFNIKWEHIDLWLIIKRVVDIHGPAYFAIRWIPAHTKQRDVDSGRISIFEQQMNDGADKLAVLGAKRHTLNTNTIKRAVYRTKLAKVLQTTACNVLDCRARTAPLEHRRVGYTDAEIAKLLPIGSAPIQQAVPDPADEDLNQLMDDSEELERMYDAAVDEDMHDDLPFGLDDDNIFE